MRCSRHIALPSSPRYRGGHSQFSFLEVPPCIYALLRSTKSTQQLFAHDRRVKAVVFSVQTCQVITMATWFTEPFGGAGAQNFVFQRAGAAPCDLLPQN